MRHLPYRSKPQFKFYKRGTTLLEVLIALSIFATNLLVTEIFIFKSLALSREAMLRSEILIEVESLADMLALYLRESTAAEGVKLPNIQIWEERLKRKLGQGQVSISIDSSCAIIEVAWLATYNPAIKHSLTCIVDRYGQHLK